MDRYTLVKQDCIREIQAMRALIETLLNRKVKYLDPDFALETTSGRNLWVRYDDVAARIAREFPELASSIPARKHPADSEQALDREDLKSLDRDIGLLLNLLNKTT